MHWNTSSYLFPPLNFSKHLMKRPPNPPPQTLEKSQDLLEILGEIMGKLDLLTGKLSKIIILV